MVGRAKRYQLKCWLLIHDRAIGIITERALRRARECDPKRKGRDRDNCFVGNDAFTITSSWPSGRMPMAFADRRKGRNPSTKAAREDKRPPPVPGGAGPPKADHRTVLSKNPTAVRSVCRARTCSETCVPSLPRNRLPCPPSPFCRKRRERERKYSQLYV